MDPNLRNLAVLAHRGVLKIKQKFPRPTILLYTGGGEVSGFMLSFSEYAEHMKSFFDLTIEPLTEGEYLFIAFTVLGGPFICIRTDMVVGWKLPTY